MQATSYGKISLVGTASKFIWNVYSLKVSVFEHVSIKVSAQPEFLKKKKKATSYYLGNVNTNTQNKSTLFFLFHLCMPFFLHVSSVSFERLVYNLTPSSH